MTITIVSGVRICRELLREYFMRMRVEIGPSFESTEQIENLPGGTIVLLHAAGPLEAIQRDLRILDGTASALAVILVVPAALRRDATALLSAKVRAVIPDNASAHALFGAVCLVTEGFAVEPAQAEARSVPAAMGLRSDRPGGAPPDREANRHAGGLSGDPVGGQGDVRPDLRLVAATRRATSLPWRDRLSPQENRILLSLVQGLSNKEIAREIGISESTVKVHLRTCFDKIGARNRTQAALWVSERLQGAG